MTVEQTHGRVSSFNLFLKLSYTFYHQHLETETPNTLLGKIGSCQASPPGTDDRAESRAFSEEGHITETARQPEGNLITEPARQLERNLCTVELDGDTEVRPTDNNNIHTRSD